MACRTPASGGGSAKEGAPSLPIHMLRARHVDCTRRWSSVMQKCYTVLMPTTKKRINITIDDATHAAISRLADEREESISRTSLRLIEEALEHQEDRYFSKVADARLRKKQRRVSHAKAWD
jgi:hypothetical protein